MRKSIIFLFVFIGVLLVGCKDGQQETVSKNDNIEQNDVDQERAEKSTRPRDLSLEGRSIVIPSARYSSCWDESNCSIKPENPEEALPDERVFQANKFYTVNSAEVLTFITSATSAYKGELIAPDLIEVTQFYNDNKEKIEVSNNQLSAPSEKGTYYLNVHAKWEDQIKGEAYYAFKLFVK
ncbi:hypothetical protein SAMN05216389_1355 [Oceanobacillus limi]|uniref:Lipoprotein n=1 Tax=Oceanobacillus limi TaxID=930131 RepID=A0A1I0HH16_9BACI|nr:hypothetical protein [Oceanobacillus limi]SET83155.1 hypothetical protein SAMN05216389_1355 [Oceanobacillus limi]